MMCLQLHMQLHHGLGHSSKLRVHQNKCSPFASALSLSVAAHKHSDAYTKEHAPACRNACASPTPTTSLTPTKTPEAFGHMLMQAEDGRVHASRLYNRGADAASLLSLRNMTKYPHLCGSIYAVLRWVRKRPMPDCKKDWTTDCA